MQYLSSKGHWPFFLRLSNKNMTTADTTIAVRYECPILNHTHIGHITELHLISHIAKLGCIWLVNSWYQKSPYTNIGTWFFKKSLWKLWPVWLSWLGIFPQSERSPVWFLVKAHDQGCGFRPGSGCTGEAMDQCFSLTLMFFSLSFSLPSFVSLKINK